MASSLVVATNSDLPRQSSVYSLSNTSMDMDELLKSIYSSEPASAKNMDEVWKEMVAGRGTNNNTSTQQHQQMTLEDSADDHGTLIVPAVGVSIAAPSPSPGTGTGRRGKRKGVEEPLLDKATLQKHRRMIKNRESAARSRERKQAYTVELESLVIQLQEDNARLLREQADRNKQRLKQLMECLIPVVEKHKPRLRRKLRRVNSVQW